MSAARRIGSIVWLGALAASRLAAHDYWLEPADLRPATGARVAIGHRVGERLTGDPVPRVDARIVRFDLVAPDGARTPVPGRQGLDPAGVATPAAPGTHWVVYQSTRARVELEPARFDAYLVAEGLEAIRAERSRRSEGERLAREAYSRSAKAALCVGGGASGPAAPPMPRPSRAPSPLGLTLELVPERDPCAPARGRSTAYQLYFRGEPLAGALVQALAPGRAAPLAARTDRRGRVELPLDAEGLWLVKAVQMVRAEGLPEIEWESFWASLVFDRRSS